MHNNEDDIIRVDGGIERIIADEIWEKANTVFKQRKRTGCPANERVYLLSGLIFCGICGNHMIGEHTNARENRQERTIYNCRGKKVKNICELKAVRKDMVENIVIEMLNHALNEQSVKTIVDNLMKEINGFNKGADRELDMLKGNLMAVKNKLNKMIDVMLETGTTPTLTERLKQFEAEKEDIENKIKFHNEKKRQFSLPTKEYLLLALSKNIGIKHKSPDEQKRIIRTYVEKILIYPDRVEVYTDRVIEYGDEENRTPSL